MADLPTLTAKQRRFVDAYIGEARFNASEAARIAGYKDAGNEGWRLRKNAEISAHIEERLSAYGASQAEILSELADVAFAEWREFVTIKTDPRTGDTLDVRMDLSNKVKSLELLGKAHQMFTEKQQIELEVARYEIIGVSDAELAGVITPKAEP